MMFIHLGGDLMVPLQEVIVILDMKTRNTSQATKEFLQLAQSEGRVQGGLPGEAKSFVVGEGGVFFSPISSTTLQKRAGFLRRAAWNDLD